MKKFVSLAAVAASLAAAPAFAATTPEEVDAWVANFLHHHPGGGESLWQVLARARSWQPPEPGASVIGHAGWMLARRWLQTHGPHQPPTQAWQWPKPPAHGQAWPFKAVPTDHACSG